MQNVILMERGHGWLDFMVKPETASKFSLHQLSSFQAKSSRYTKEFQDLADKITLYVDLIITLDTGPVHLEKLIHFLHTFATVLT